MPGGRADGDGGVAASHAKKRRLDNDALQLGLGTGSRESKRRHTAGHHRDGSASNSSSLRSREQDVNGYGALKTSKFQQDTALFSSRPSDAPAPPTQHSLRPPNTSHTAAKASGAPGSSGGSWGATPSLPGGLFSGRRRHKLQLSSGPPTSSTTSSDASSIPALSAQTFSATTPKNISQTSSHSLGYGNKSANRPVAVHGILKSHSTGHAVLGSGRPQSGPQDKIPPSSHRHRSKKEQFSIYEILNSPSGEDSYLEDQDEGSNDNDDKHATTLPEPEQRSARLKPRSRGSNLVDPEHEPARLYWNKTPLGKDYHVFSGEVQSYATYNSNFDLPDERLPSQRAKFALFPDGYKLQRYNHNRSEFNDNLDEIGTLEYLGKRKDSYPGEESIVVSRNRRRPPAKSSGPLDSDASKAILVNENSKSPDLRLNSLSTPDDADEDSTSTTPSDLDRAMADSKVWAYVAPLVPQTWTASITDSRETRAFIQAISLPLRNKMDMEWLAGTKKSHQRGYRALMSVIFLTIGAEARCKPCESKIPERRRNCKVLPPEAEGMRELQEIYGSQCVNCYFFHASKPCEFPASSAMTKQTPIPVPTPPSARTMPNFERSLDQPPAARPPPAASRPPVPSYSSYKAKTAEKPISESPVPIPLFANRSPNHQGQSSQRSYVSTRTSDAGIPRGVRQSGRVAKANDQSNGSSNQGSDKTDEAESHSAISVTSIARPLEAVLTSSGLTSSEPSTKESTAVASSLPSSETSSSQLAGRAFSLFGDISQLPPEEQSALWNQMQHMAGMLQIGPAKSASITKGSSPNLPPGPSEAVAADWEIAPGKLIVDDEHLAFSTSFLNREVISVKAAQRLSPTQRVLNKSIRALDQLTVRPEDDWDCTCSVIRGVLKLKVGDVRASIGQGGVIVVKRECIITNISHKETRIQMWWKKADD